MKGREVGLKGRLEVDKKALIAFLKTLWMRLRFTEPQNQEAI